MRSRSTRITTLSQRLSTFGLLRRGVLCDWSPMWTAWVCRSGANEGVVERCMLGHGQLSETECRSGRWYQTGRSDRELVPNRSLSPTRWYQSGQAHLRIGTKLPMRAHSLVPNRLDQPVNWYQIAHAGVLVGTKPARSASELVPNRSRGNARWYQTGSTTPRTGTKSSTQERSLVPTARIVIRWYQPQGCLNQGEAATRKSASNGGGS
jgi:hypothetical protein